LINLAALYLNVAIQSLLKTLKILKLNFSKTATYNSSTRVLSYTVYMYNNLTYDQSRLVV